VADLKTIVDHRPVACLILPEEALSEVHLRALTRLCRARNIDLMKGGLQLQSIGLTPYTKAS
jgi:hypothetical protein